MADLMGQIVTPERVIREWDLPGLDHAEVARRSARYIGENSSDRGWSHATTITVAAIGSIAGKMGCPAESGGGGCARRSVISASATA